MAILQTVQSACLYLDLERPNALYASTDRTWLEMGDVVNLAARQIADDYDWQRLLKVATITGDGTALSFSTPSDFDRMIRDANLWGPSYTFYPSQQVQDFNQWLQMQSWAIETWQQQWAVFGGNINIMPVLPAGETLTYGYVSNSIVQGSDPTRFVADTDTFILDEELLRLGIIWTWKQTKGFDFTADLARYSDELEKKRFRDVGSRQTIYSGRSTRWPTGQSFL